MHCNTLCCTVLYCTVLCCVVLCCAVLYCTVLHCTALHCTALHYIVLHCGTALHCTALHYTDQLTVSLTSIVPCRGLCTLAMYMYTCTINGGDLSAVYLVYGWKVKGETIHLHLTINPKSTCFRSAIISFPKQDDVLCYFF